MERYQLLMWGLKLIWLAFVFAYGAIVGSFINVIVYRRPRGISIVSPPSRCPSCNTRLTWRDNIPVFGWLFLRGRCRYCQVKISPEYPLVEASVGVLFCIFFIVWYILPDLYPAHFLGVNWGAMIPIWARNDASQTWPTFLLLLILLSCLVAMTIIDARTFTIPLELTWIPAAAAVVIHTVHAAVVGIVAHRPWDSDVWMIPTPGPFGWGGVFAVVGAVLGLGISVLLVKLGLLRRSFADYAEWEQSIAVQQPQQPLPASTTPPSSNVAGAVSLPDPTSAAPTALSESASTEPAAPPASAPEVTLTPATDAAPADLWTRYPHARREMLWEMLYLAPCLLLMMGGQQLGRYLGGVVWNPFLQIWVLTKDFTLFGKPAPQWLVALAPFHGHKVPIWADAMAAALLGYLIGGGVVWAVRILGSIAFGKEAMGLGDVHLMAAVGACLGWIYSTLAFFGASFVGLAWVVLGLVLGGRLKRTMPYGPYLAASTVLVLLGKPLIAAGLGWIFGHPVEIGP